MLSLLLQQQEFPGLGVVLCFKSNEVRARRHLNPPIILPIPAYLIVAGSLSRIIHEVDDFPSQQVVNDEADMGFRRERVCDDGAGIEGVGEVLAKLHFLWQSGFIPDP